MMDVGEEKRDADEADQTLRTEEVTGGADAFVVSRIAAGAAPVATFIYQALLIAGETGRRDTGLGGQLGRSPSITSAIIETVVEVALNGVAQCAFQGGSRQTEAPAHRGNRVVGFGERVVLAADANRSEGGGGKGVAI